MCSTIAEEPKDILDKILHLVTWSSYILFIAVFFVEKLIAVSVCVYMISVVEICIHNALILCSCLFIARL